MSALKEIYRGNKELFKDTFIYQSDYSFDKHNVYYNDFNISECRKPDNINFSHLMSNDKYNRNQKSVVIINAYDNPSLYYNEHDDAHILRRSWNLTEAPAFYKSILDKAHLYEKIIISGSDASYGLQMFPGYKGIEKINLNGEFSGLVGICKEELKLYFDEYIEAIAKGRKVDDIVGEKEKMYRELG